MHIAIGFWGLSRSLHNTSSSIKTNIINKLKEMDINITIFVHTFTKNNIINNPRAGEIKIKHYNSFEECMKYDYIEIENDEMVREQLNLSNYKTCCDIYNNNYITIENTILSFYSKKKLCIMIKDSKIKFDHIIILRPDMLYLTPFKLSYLLKNNENNICVPDFHVLNLINDRMFILTIHNLEYFGNIFDNLVKYSKQNTIHSETIYYYYLIENKKLNIVYIPFYFVRMRLTGNPDKKDYTIYKIFNDNKYNEKILDHCNYSNYPHQIIEENKINKKNIVNKIRRERQLDFNYVSFEEIRNTWFRKVRTYNSKDLENYKLPINDSNNIIWITLITKSYVLYAKNFLLSLKKNNVNIIIVVYCFDNETKEILNTFSNCICINIYSILSNINFENNDSNKLHTYKKNRYTDIVFLKLDVIKFTLERTIGSVGFIDMDITIISDPTPIIQELMNQFKNHIIFCQCNEKKLICCQTNNNNCDHINSGVMVFRNDPICIDLLNYSEEDKKHFCVNQTYFNEKIKQKKIKLRTISPKIFINGSYPGILQKKKIYFDNSVSLIHYNWIEDIDFVKIDLMKAQDKWYVDCKD